LDIASGLRRAANNQQLYRQSLSRFVTDFADYNETFTRHIANAEWKEAERLAHTLKGLSATLGANEVSLSASNLETVCKGKQVEAATNVLFNLMMLLTPLLTALQQYFAEEEASKPMGVELTDQSGETPDCLPQLLQLLNEGDSHAIEIWEMHHQEFSRALPEQVTQRITIALQNFEFDTAQILLADLSVKVSTSETIDLKDKP